MTEMTTENFTALVRNTTFAADMVAMDAAREGKTGADVTKRVVARVIEFLYGNDLMTFKNDGSSLWLKLEPPFDKEILDIAGEPVVKERINNFHEDEKELCECDRPDQAENPHRHKLEAACVYWAAGRPSQAARMNASYYLGIYTD